MRAEEDVRTGKHFRGPFVEMFFGSHTQNGIVIS